MSAPMSKDEILETAEETGKLESLNDQIINQVGKDYAEYLNISVSLERQQFDDSIEAMLTRLDEYLGLVSLIRSDTNLCLETTLPVLQSKSEQMAKIFDRIDRLEEFVGMVGRSMVVTEENLNKAEVELRSVNSIRKMFSNISMPSFLSKPKPAEQQRTRSPAHRYTPPEIFDTSEYVHYPQRVRAKMVANEKSSNTKGGQWSSKSPPLSPERNSGEGVSQQQKGDGSWPAIGKT